MYAARYPIGRFKKLSDAQRQAVISMRAEYNAQHKQTGKDHLVAAMSAVKEDMSGLEDCIISAVQRGSGETNDDASRLTNNTAGDDSTKRKAVSEGSIGSFLVSQNKRSRS